MDLPTPSGFGNDMPCSRRRYGRDRVARKIASFFGSLHLSSFGGMGDGHGDMIVGEHVRPLLGQRAA